MSNAIYGSSAMSKT